MSSRKGPGKLALSAEEQANFQKDLAEISRRLGELTGVAAPAGGGGDPATGKAIALLAPSSSVSSPFVSGLRGKTSTVVGGEASSEGDRGESDAGGDSKLRLLETVLQRLTELDRVVLKKTAPEMAPGNVAARRSSRGFDLVSLPTHLHLVDRLLDLHAQARRVTVIRTAADSNAAPGPPPEPAQSASSAAAAALASSSSSGAPSPRSKQAADRAERLAAEVARLSKQVEETVEQRRAVQEDCSAARREASAAKRDLEAARRELEQAAAGGDRWQELLRQEQQLTRQLSEQVEAAASTQQAFIAAISHRCSSLAGPGSGSGSGSSSSSSSSSGGGGGGGGGATTAPLPAEVGSCLAMLDDALAHSSGQLREQLESLLSVKDSVECELASQHTRCELTQRDLEATARQLDALKGAYSALEIEAAQRGSSSAQSQAQAQQAQQAQLAESTISELSSDLARAQRRIKDLEKVADSVVDIEARLRQAEEAKASLQGRLSEATQESEANARTCESLRAKLRELSARGKDRDFLDSYEEVMRDEMMTMKDAFERKLRLAKEEAEASSRRNSELIRNLSTERLGLAKR